MMRQFRWRIAAAAVSFLALMVAPMAAGAFDFPPPSPPDEPNILCVEKTASSGGNPITEVDEGTTTSIDYAIKVTAGGTGDSLGVTVTDTLPGEANVLLTNNGGCSVSAKTLTCNLGTMPAGTTQTVNISVDIVNAVLGDTYTNTAKVNSPTDQISNDNDCSNDITVAEVPVPVVDLQCVGKDAEPGELTEGNNGPISYTVTVRNNSGSETATGVVITDTLPANVTFVSADFGCSEVGGVVECVIGDLGPNAVASRTIVVDADTNLPPGTVLTNTAGVTGNEVDDVGNNSCEASTTIVEQPPGGEGCSPGYWKNHLDQWGAAGLTPGDDFDATFGLDWFTPDITLGEAISLKGGGKKKLARFGVAALLGFLHPSVDSHFASEGEIVALMIAGDKATLELWTSNAIDGCPID